LCLIAENGNARIEKTSETPPQFIVIDGQGQRPFDNLVDAQNWYDLIPKNEGMSL
jgi:hypothetical protein